MEPFRAILVFQQFFQISSFASTVVWNKYTAVLCIGSFIFYKEKHQANGLQ
jgi:hypothetical protein